MRTAALWIALIVYFMVGYSVAPKQKLVSPELFSNIVLGSAFVVTLVIFVRRKLIALPRKATSGAIPEAKYRLRFFFDGGHCLWSGNDAAHSLYGYPITPAKLPISPDLATRIEALAGEQVSSLDSSNPAGPSPWTSEQFASFRSRTDDILALLREALGAEFVVDDEREHGRSTESA